MAADRAWLIMTIQNFEKVQKSINVDLFSWQLFDMLKAENFVVKNNAFVWEIYYNMKDQNVCLNLLKLAFDEFFATNAKQKRPDYEQEHSIWMLLQHCAEYLAVDVIIKHNLDKIVASAFMAYYQSLDPCQEATNEDISICLWTILRKKDARFTERLMDCLMYIYNTVTDTEFCKTYINNNHIVRNKFIPFFEFLQLFLTHNDKIHSSLRKRFPELLSFLFLYLSYHKLNITSDNTTNSIITLLCDMFALDDAAQYLDAEYTGHLFIIMLHHLSSLSHNDSLWKAESFMLLCNNLCNDNTITESFKLQFHLAIKKGLFDIIINLHKTVSQTTNGRWFTQKQDFLKECEIFAKNYFDLCCYKSLADKERFQQEFLPVTLAYAQNSYVMETMLKNHLAHCKYLLFCQELRKHFPQLCHQTLQ